jgi:hypothetical protein
VPLIVSFNTVCVVYLAVDEGFSTVGVLDIPLGALLLYYLPHTAERSTGREIGEKQSAKGRGQDKSSAYKHTAGTSGQHDSASEGKRGDRDIDIDNSTETAQIASPFCVVDIRWLLQLNEQYGTEESNVREHMSEEDIKGTFNRLEKKTSLGFGKSKNDDDARYLYSTTSRKKEVLDSMQFLQNSVVIITKTHMKTRTVRRTRSSSINVKNPQDSPHFAADPNNRGIEAGGQVRKGVQKVVDREEGKSRPTADKAVSGLSGKIEGDEVSDEDESRRASRLEDEDVKEEVTEEVKLVGGTIYTCSILGKYECFPFLSPLFLLLSPNFSLLDLLSCSLSFLLSPLSSPLPLSHPFLSSSSLPPLPLPSSNTHNTATTLNTLKRFSLQINSLRRP